MRLFVSDPGRWVSGLCSAAQAPMRNRDPGTLPAVRLVFMIFCVWLAADLAGVAASRLAGTLVSVGWLAVAFPNQPDGGPGRSVRGGVGDETISSRISSRDAEELTACFVAHASGLFGVACSDMRVCVLCGQRDRALADDLVQASESRCERNAFPNTLPSQLRPLPPCRPSFRGVT
jgi:hypothetical protein